MSGLVEVHRARNAATYDPDASGTYDALIIDIGPATRLPEKGSHQPAAVVLIQQDVARHCDTTLTVASQRSLILSIRSPASNMRERVM